MAPTVTSFAAAVLTHGSLPESAAAARALVNAELVLATIGGLFSALRRVAQIVSGLLTAAAAVGSVLVLMVVLLGLFAVALIFNVPV